MKRPLNDVVLFNENPDRKSEPGKCKYKMKVNLTDELNQLMHSRSSSVDKENMNRQQQDYKPPIRIRETDCTVKPLNKSISKEMTRSVSRLDINNRSRMIRSDSEIMRQSIGDPRVAAKTDGFAYKSLFRSFQRTTKTLKSPNILKEDQIADILSLMGFLPRQISAEDQAMLGSLRFMLSWSNKGASLNNFFLFIMVICNINPEVHEHYLEGSQPSSQAATALSKDKQGPRRPLVLIQIGHFSNDGDWKTTSQERKKIRRIFGKLYYNKISNDQIKFKRVDPEERPSFQPKILEHSREIAKARRAKILRQANQYCDMRADQHETIDLAELLVLDKKVKEGKITIKIKQKEDREQNQCTFQPKVNKTSESLKTDYSGNSSCQSKDRCLELFEKSKQMKSSKAEIKKPTLEEIEATQLKQCTFKPASTKYAGSKQVNIPVKNQQKLIQRLKEGRELRVLNDTIKNRGYPQNQNWDKFVKQYKKKASQQIPNNNSASASKLRTESVTGDRTPILSMDIKLHSDTFQLQVYDGDSIQALTCKILVRHELPYERFTRIAELISNVVNGCKGIVVIDGIVHQTSN